MTYPLEDICISISVRRQLDHGLNACTGTIMNKLCIFIPAWDIYIMKIAIASLSESNYIKKKNIDLHHILFALIEKIGI